MEGIRNRQIRTPQAGSEINSKMDEMVENQHGPDRPRDGFLEPHNGVVARGPAKEGSDRKRVVWPISSGSSPGDDNKASEDGIKRVPTGRAKDVNFSHFLRPALIKVTKPRCGGLPELGCSSGLVGKPRVTGDQRQTWGPEQKVDISPDADPTGNLCPDKRFPEPSSSMLASNLEGKRARGVELTQVPAMSVCSHGASNEPKVYPKRLYEDCQSSSQSDSDSEDYGRCDRADGTKERRSSAHRSSERSRRGRINKKLRALQELLPNCDKVDQAGVLDKAIEYLKTLQQQLLFQVLSSRSPMYLSPPMMQQIYSPYRTQIPTFNVPRGMSLGLQFPTATAAFSLQPVPPFVPSALGRSSSPSLSLDSSRPTDSVDDLLDSSYQSGSSGDDQS